jgi:hypothetical protein
MDTSVVLVKPRMLESRMVAMVEPLKRTSMTKTMSST